MIHIIVIVIIVVIIIVIIIIIRGIITIAILRRNTTGQGFIIFTQ